MDIKDILGIGKVLPIDKLIDIISKATGILTKSYFDKRDVDSKAYEIRELAKAKADALGTVSAAISKNSDAISGISYNDAGFTIESFKQTREEYIQRLPSPDLSERTKYRVDHQEIRKQINIESVTAFANEELKNEPPVTDEPVNEDWSSRFFKYAEDISDEEMQSIWGKILAGEIKQPNTFSLRTLELLRNISKREAEVFAKAANYAIVSGDDIFIHRTNLTDYGLDFAQMALLQEIGIMHESAMTNFTLPETTTSNNLLFVVGNILIINNRKANSFEKSMPVYVFTQVGKQLLKLISTTPDKTYLNKLAIFLKDENTETKYAFLINKAGDKYYHTNPLLEFPMQ